MLTPETRDLLVRTKALLVGGWCKRALTDGKGNYCLLGALNMAEHGSAYGAPIATPHGLEGYEMVVAIIGWDIAGWNNAPERTHNQVVALFDRILLDNTEPEATEDHEYDYTPADFDQVWA